MLRRIFRRRGARPRLQRIPSARATHLYDLLDKEEDHTELASDEPQVICIADRFGHGSRKHKVSDLASILSTLGNADGQCEEEQYLRFMLEARFFPPQSAENAINNWTHCESHQHDENCACHTARHFVFLTRIAALETNDIIIRRGNNRDLRDGLQQFDNGWVIRPSSQQGEVHIPGAKLFSLVQLQDDHLTASRVLDVPHFGVFWLHEKITDKLSSCDKINDLFSFSLVREYFPCFIDACAAILGPNAGATFVSQQALNAKFEGMAPDRGLVNPDDTGYSMPTARATTIHELPDLAGDEVRPLSHSSHSIILHITPNFWFFVALSLMLVIIILLIAILFR